MRAGHPIEQEVGITWYASESDGVGGRLKTEPSDFQVTEIEGIDPQPIDADSGAYPHVIVRVRLSGWDTFGFVRRLGSELGIHRGAIDWAGTKDKEAITVQLYSIKGVDPDDLPEIPGASLEPVGRFGRGLTFGDLLGNRFELRVRDATTPDQATAITEDLRAFGDGRIAFPNFFGQQRFGSRRPITHLVGLAILERDWEGAVMTYLGNPSDREPEATQAARGYIEETRDWEGGIERLPRGLGHERRLLEVLRDADTLDETTYRTALERFPEQLRQLFVHAAQSYMFNRIVSERRTRNIPLTRAVSGDIVCFAEPHEELGPIPDLDRTQEVTEGRIETINRHIASGRAFVTAPLVGTETSLGETQPDAIVRDVLSECGVAPADFDLPDPYDSTGTVRPLLVFPELDIETDPLTFAFGLPSGAYATVLMREYLKVDPDAMS